MRGRSAPAPHWWVYVVRTGGGELYTGIATDVERRVDAHARGRGARYLRGRGPLELVYERRIGGRGLALRVERGLKRRARAEKQRIVEAGMSRAALLRLLALG